jgi:hypothetical protein
MVGAGHGRGMASVNQTRPHCVNQMAKTHSKPLAARHGKRRAWARHAMCESAFKKQRRRKSRKKTVDRLRRYRARHLMAESCTTSSSEFGNFGYPCVLAGYVAINFCLK